MRTHTVHALAHLLLTRWKSSRATKHLPCARACAYQSLPTENVCCMCARACELDFVCMCMTCVFECRGLLSSPRTPFRQCPHSSKLATKRTKKCSCHCSSYCSAESTPALMTARPDSTTVCLSFAGGGCNGLCGSTGAPCTSHSRHMSRSQTATH